MLRGPPATFGDREPLADHALEGFDCGTPSPERRGARGSWRPDGDQVVGEPEVGRVVGEQQDTRDVRGRGDREVHRSAVRLPTALSHRGGKPAPLASYGGVDRERVERSPD